MLALSNPGSASASFGRRTTSSTSACTARIFVVVNPRPQAREGGGRERDHGQSIAEEPRGPAHSDRALA